MGYHRRLDDGGMLDEHALEFERRHLVVRRLEHVVGAADVGDVAVFVAAGDVAGVVVPTGHHGGVALRVTEVPGHQVQRRLGQVQADLALVGRLTGERVDQHHRHPRHGPAHRARLHRLSGRVADLQRGLGLAEAVADGQSPGAVHGRDHLGIERFAGAENFPQRLGPLTQVGLDQHPPHRRRRAERGDARAAHLRQQRGGVEPGVVVDEDGRLGDPRREEATPGVLGPAGRADRQVDVTRAAADPRHRRHVADRIADLGVLHQLGPAGRAGGEVDQQRVVDRCARVERARGLDVVRIGVGMPVVAAVGRDIPP